MYYTIQRIFYSFGVYQLLVYVLIVITGFTACTSGDFSHDINLTGSNTRLVMIDTCTIEFNTGRFDSIATSSKEVLLCGISDRSQTGILTASACAMLTLPEMDERDIEAVFDSICLHLTSTGYYHGDTLTPFGMRVVQLSQVPDNENSGTFYNTSKFVASDNTLGHAVWNMKPSLKKELRIKLADNLGIDLLNKLMNDEDETSTEAKFDEYFKGLVLLPDAGNKAVYGFTTGETFYIRLYYHLTHSVKEEKELDFALGSDEIYFNQLSTDYTSTIWNGLIYFDRLIPSAETDHRVLVRSGSGVYTKIRFPYLRKLLELSKFGFIVKAELIIKPVVGTYTSETLPAKLNLYESNDLDETVSLMTDANQNTLDGDLQIDDTYNQHTEYRFDITTFLNAEIDRTGYDCRSLQLTGSEADLSTTVNQLVAGDGMHPQQNSFIRIYYLLYDEK